MKRKLNLIALTALFAVPAWAGSITWTFDDWPYSVTNLNLASGQAAPLSYQQPGGGNPDTGGFLELTPAAPGRNLEVIFPDIDNGVPVKAFKLTADMRVGNGSEVPADGFSISYVRDTDVALSNALNVTVSGGTDPVYDPPIGLFRGFAGGDSLAAAQDPAGGTNPETGTKTGVSISFDAWKGNWLPDGTNAAPGNDIVGISVRVDDKTLISKSLSQANADCSNTNSMQTGPYDATQPSAWQGLSWCRLEVEKTADNKVNVTWKGAKILDGYQLTSYSVHKGRLILAGRTGDNHQNVHFDNITLETVPGIEATFKSMAVNSDLKGWSFQLEDTGASQVTNVSQVLWNGNDVTASVVVSKVGNITTGTYTQANRLPSGSANQLAVTFKTALNQTLSGVGAANTPAYMVMPTAYALPASAVSGQPRGIALGQLYQTIEANRNSQGDNRLNWTEEQLIGLRGANLISGSWPTVTDVLDYQNANTDPTFALNGNFRVGGSIAVPPFWDGPDYSLSTLGFGSNPAKTSTDDGTIEWNAYVNFPAAGTYYMVVNSDDGFRLTTARNSKDRMGTIMAYYEGGRGNGTGLDAGPVNRIEVDAAGVYPIRGIIENQGGGFNVEWYTRSGTNLYLVNSNSTAEALQAWQTATGAGCYVQSAIPVRDAIDVPGNQKIIIDLANGTTTVNAGTITLKVDGVAVSPVFTGLHLEAAPTGADGLWAANSSHTIELSFTDSASTSYNYTWNFKAAPYTVLANGFPLGSQDPAKVGFTYSTFQIDPLGTTQLPNRIHVGEQVLQGMWGTNDALVPTGPVSGVINFNVEANNQGNFHAGNGYPDGLVPGIPSTNTHPNESFANEILTYVEFPAAGMYTLGFNSDDGFRTTAGFARPTKTAQITILSPASIAGGKPGVMPAANGGAEVQLTSDVTAQVVLAQPITADTPLVNAAQVSGKIALCIRGVNAFADKIAKCAQAGAIGVIVAQNRPVVNPGEGIFPIEMGSTAGPIPAVMTYLDTLVAMTNAMATTTVTATLNARPDPAASIGEADVGRGATDTLMYVQVPSPGLYALRTMWWQGGGGGNCEWFSVKGGTKILLNDTTNPDALKCWYGLLPSVKPTVTITTKNGIPSVTGQGTLQRADVVTGPYVDVYGPNPVPAPAGSSQGYYRARQ